MQQQTIALAQRKYKGKYNKAVKQAIDFAFNSVDKNVKDKFLQMEDVYNATVYYMHKYMPFTADNENNINYE